MSYLKFDKSQLVNLEYSLNKEIIRSNRSGSYISSTLNGCNTRKYHGLLVAPIKKFDNEKHVLLSSLDASVIQNNAEFNLGIHRYKDGKYEPKGHKYIRNLQFDKIPKITYRVGGVVLTKERILVENEQQALIKYTLEEAHSRTILRLKPYLAFRNIHNLSKANLFVNSKFINVNNGIKIRLYDGYPYLHLQLNKKCEFIPVPDWYYNIEYLKEKTRGYDYLEDLYVPGYFEIAIKKGESIIVSASTFEVTSKTLKQKFTRELKKRINLDSFSAFLGNAASQFIFKKKNEIDIIAGFPWYGSITRQTFISLPGLVESINSSDLYSNVLKTYVKYLKEGLFPDSIDSKTPVYNSVDSPLWFFWTIQQWLKKENISKELWKEFGPAMKSILNNYRRSSSLNNKMLENGLIYSGNEKVALSWMNSNVSGKPVVHRKGLNVEINALWYNAVCFAMDLAEKSNDYKFINSWYGIPEMIKESFLNIFWKPELGYLADYVDNDSPDLQVRPNMIIATSLDYCMLTKAHQKSVLSICRNQLLTPRGLRTLSPDNEKYKGIIEGNPEERELAVHQGAVHPWLIQFFIEGYLNVHKRGGLPFVKKIMESFEDELREHCIGTISETYNGNPPHKAKGAVSQAWNVAAIVRANKIVKDFESKSE